MLKINQRIFMLNVFLGSNTIGSSGGMQLNQGSSMNIREIIEKLKQLNQQHSQQNVREMIINGQQGGMTINGGNTRGLSIGAGGMQISNQASQAQHIIENSQNMHASHGSEMTIGGNDKMTIGGSGSGMSIDGDSFNIGNGFNPEVPASWNQHQVANEGKQVVTAQMKEN
jgi:hypothetical protein